MDLLQIQQQNCLPLQLRKCNGKELIVREESPDSLTGKERNFPNLTTDFMF